eukprot:scaffold221251_cov32-Tisochrysis_lutea.AAC.4
MCKQPPPCSLPPCLPVHCQGGWNAKGGRGQMPIVLPTCQSKETDKTHTQHQDATSPTSISPGASQPPPCDTHNVSFPGSQAELDFDTRDDPPTRNTSPTCEAPMGLFREYGSTVSGSFNFRCTRPICPSLPVTQGSSHIASYQCVLASQPAANDSTAHQVRAASPHSRAPAQKRCHRRIKRTTPKSG